MDPSLAQPDPLLLSTPTLPHPHHAAPECSLCLANSSIPAQYVSGLLFFILFEAYNNVESVYLCQWFYWSIQRLPVCL